MLSTSYLSGFRLQKSYASRIRQTQAMRNYNISKSDSPKVMQQDDSPVLLCSPLPSFNPFKCPSTANIYSFQKQIDVPRTPKILADADLDLGMSIFEEKAAVFNAALESFDILEQVLFERRNLVQTADVHFIALQIFQYFFARNSANDYFPQAVLLSSLQLSAKLCNVPINTAKFIDILHSFDSQRVVKAVDDTERIVFDSQFSYAWRFTWDLFSMFDPLDDSIILEIMPYSEEAPNLLSLSMVETPKSSVLFKKEEVALSEIIAGYVADEFCFATSAELCAEARRQNFSRLSDYVLYSVYSQVLLRLSCFDSILTLPFEHLSTTAMKLALTMLFNYHLAKRGEVISAHCINSLVARLSGLQDQQQSGVPGCSVFTYYYDSPSNFMLQNGVAKPEDYGVLLNSPLGDQNDLLANSQGLQGNTFGFTFRHFDDCLHYVENTAQLALGRRLLSLEQIDSTNFNELTFARFAGHLSSQREEISAYFAEHKSNQLFCKQPGCFIYQVAAVKRQITFETDSLEYTYLCENLRRNEKSLQESMKKQIYKELDGILLKYSVMDGDIFLNNSYI